jgi:hypothetical protein
MSLKMQNEINELREHQDVLRQMVEELAGKLEELETKIVTGDPRKPITPPAFPATLKEIGFEPPKEGVTDDDSG